MESIRRLVRKRKAKAEKAGKAAEVAGRAAEIAGKAAEVAGKAAEIIEAYGLDAEDDMDRAVAVAVRATGYYPVSAFVYEGTYYVSVTPLPDYVPGEDTAVCFAVVKRGTVVDFLSVGDFFFDFDMSEEEYDAMMASPGRSYIERRPGAK